MESESHSEPGRQSASPTESLSDSNTSASQLFASMVADAMVPADQLSSMVVIQQRMLARFERTNALLSTAIDVSSHRLLPPGAPQQMLSFNSGLIDRIPSTDVVQDVRRASVQLGELRERLFNATRRIRNLKTKCAKLYPQAFDECEKSLGLQALNGQIRVTDDDEGNDKETTEIKESRKSVSLSADEKAPVSPPKETSDKNKDKLLAEQ